ncbi:YjaG family protein [Parashewanella tropica]|uniref:YjaG family protein n=1 Tax=Parashewanella tropica TaxID=2547970 RepID=UPI00105A08FB|nr:YjaG family protein [Parashewanella tropica]
MTKKIGFFKRLKSLSLEQKQLFAIALCQRMYPNYALFSEVCEFGNPQVLKTTLDLLWQKQYDKKLKFNLELYLERLDEVVPEPEDYDVYGVYPAIDAVVALTSLLSAIQSKIEDDITNISKISSSTVASYIEATCEQEFETETEIEDYVFAHPAMDEEREVQAMLLEVIETNPLNAEFIKGLRAEIIESGISNIGVAV